MSLEDLVKFFELEGLQNSKDKIKPEKLYTFLKKLYLEASLVKETNEIAYFVKDVEFQKTFQDKLDTYILISLRSFWNKSKKKKKNY